MGSTELFGREPDLVVTSDELMAEGLLIDPDIYGPYVKYGDRPVNRWSNGARDLIRDYFASGASPVPFWGVLGDVLGVIVPDLEEIDPEDGPQNIPPSRARAWLCIRGCRLRMQEPTLARPGLALAHPDRHTLAA